VASRGSAKDKAIRRDIDIARTATVRPITETGTKPGIRGAALRSYGTHKAKISLDFLDGLKIRPSSAAEFLA